MQTKQKGKNLATLPFFLEQKTGLALAQSASDGRDPLSTSPAPERGALRSRASNPVPPPKNKKENLAILLSFATLASLERKTGLALALCASDGRDSLSTPPAPEKGALRSRGQAPGMPCINNKRENRTGSPFVVGAENGFPTQAYSLLTISALREAFSSKVTPVMRSSCTRLHPNAFDKGTNYFHFFQKNIAPPMLLF